MEDLREGGEVVGKARGAPYMSMVVLRAHKRSSGIQEAMHVSEAVHLKVQTVYNIDYVIVSCRILQTESKTVNPLARMRISRQSV